MQFLKFFTSYLIETPNDGVIKFLSIIVPLPFYNLSGQQL